MVYITAAVDGSEDSNMFSHIPRVVVEEVSEEEKKSRLTGGG